ncbi:CbtA family protein [Roseovarius sp. EL26]|uniref:CbtA family protein n=1 Tax=Roseovarius sp. EL26 TaxID=2126672 RepID=UPI000EA36CDC|nr:CbtA family protein [Roseovarius sp. EL26]
MFQKILTSALFAGFCTGLLAALLQLVFVQPVLLHAELYEGGDLVHFGAAAVSAHQDLGGIDLMRDGLSVLFTALIYTGYAFVLVAMMSMASERGFTVNARTGLIWGIAGFIAMHFAPAFSLPPEVPGVAAADVAERQVWWWATVAVTALGLGLFAFGKGVIMYVIAGLLIAAPHLVGAPHPDEFAGPVPPEIAALFASRALGVGFAAWALLGTFAGYFWQKEAADA